MQRKKKIMISFIVGLMLIVGMGTIDYSRVKYDSKSTRGFIEPLFSIRTGSAAGGFSDSYLGIFYRIYVGTDGKYERMSDSVYKCIVPFPLNFFGGPEDWLCSFK